MRYPRYKVDTILRLREAGPVQRPDGRVKRYIYYDPLPENPSRHARHRGVYSWGAALTIPFAIAYLTGSASSKTESRKGHNER
jgi:hypothetical protein